MLLIKEVFLLGLLSFFLLSVKKTKTMNKIAKLMLNPNLSSLQKIMREKEKIDKAFESLYRTMSLMPGFSDILEKHNARSEDLKKIAYRVLLAGYMFAKNGDYIPVAVISFGKPLDHVLTHKEKIVNYSNKEIIEVIEETITLL